MPIIGAKLPGNYTVRERRLTAINLRIRLTAALDRTRQKITFSARISASTKIAYSTRR